MGNSLISEMSAVRTLDVEARGAGSTNGEAVDTRGFDSLLLSINLGAMAVSATFDAKLQESADGSSGWADITGAAITQRTQAGGDSNSAIVGFLNLHDRLRYVRCVFTVATNAVDCGAVIVLGGAQYATDAGSLAFEVTT